MNVKKTTIVRLVILVVGIFGAITGFAFGFSGGQINLIPIPGLTYANTASGFLIGFFSILIALGEAYELNQQYHQTKGNIDSIDSKHSKK